MSQIEFVASQGYSFTVSLRNPNAAYASLATGLAVTQVTPGVYRCNTGSVTGVVYVEATAGALRVVGFANLDEPGANSYSEVFDTLAEAEAAGESLTVNVNVLPGRDRGLPQSNRGRIVIAQGELITISRQVVDGNGAAMNLSGRTLQFIIQDARGVDVAIVPNSSITVSGTGNSTYTFVVPIEASARAGNFSYWLNDLGASKAELAKGDWIVEARPLADT